MSREGEAVVRILDWGIDAGKLVFTVLGRITEFERDVMLGRQGAGIAMAKAAGRLQGLEGGSYGERRLLIQRYWSIVRV